MSVAIVAARRTPLGSFLGQFSEHNAPDLAAAAIKAVVSDSRLADSAFDEAIMGCVLPAGVGQNPTRQATLQAGLPYSVTTTTIEKVCGSGMRAVMLGHDMILAASAKVVIAGGMESMSNAPYLLPHARKGQRFGHDTVIDHMLFDGLQNAYDGETMGHFGQLCANEFGFERQALDEFALTSVQRARSAMEEGKFAAEICAVENVSANKNNAPLSRDEEPFRCDPARIPDLKPVFHKDGTITAASSASLADGAAALVLVDEKTAHEQNLPVLANIVAHASFAHAPQNFPTAPIGALRQIFEKTAWSVQDVDLFEINEAFASVVMAAEQKHHIDHAKVNVHGGACALGHPLGTSGARILVTLIHALRTYGKHKGIAVLCIGGGESTAIAVEIPA